MERDNFKLVTQSMALMLSRMMHSVLDSDDATLREQCTAYIPITIPAGFAEELSKLADADSQLVAFIYAQIFVSGIDAIMAQANMFSKDGIDAHVDKMRELIGIH